jgi:NTP pyrophosphatase (non-canonical NTP hydrolase)
VTTIADLQARVHKVSQDKGWWEAERTVGDLIALMHSELTEALEEYREGRGPGDVYYTCQELDAGGRVVGSSLAESRDEIPPGMLARPEGVAVQLGDCVIRILDFCARWGVDLEALLEEKVAYNERYPYRSKVI